MNYNELVSFLKWFQECNFTTLKDLRDFKEKWKITTNKDLLNKMNECYVLGLWK